MNWLTLIDNMQKRGLSIERFKDLWELDVRQQAIANFGFSLDEGEDADDHLITFSFEGHAIHAPFMDVGLRDMVDPFDYYGETFANSRFFLWATDLIRLCDYCRSAVLIDDRIWVSVRGADDGIFCSKECRDEAANLSYYPKD
jgi:hypothetical protein